MSRVALVLLLLLGGCAVASYDNVPDGVPRGYVEFYPDGPGGIGGPFGDGIPWQIWREQGGKAEQVTGQMFFGSQKRRIADTPGKHVFQIRLGSGIERVLVEIREGMVTPVRVRIDRRGSESTFTGSRNIFSLVYFVEAPVPFKE